MGRELEGVDGETSLVRVKERDLGRVELVGLGEELPGVVALYVDIDDGVRECSRPVRLLEPLGDYPGKGGLARPSTTDELVSVP